MIRSCLICYAQVLGLRQSRHRRGFFDTEMDLCITCSIAILLISPLIRPLRTIITSLDPEKPNIVYLASRHIVEGLGQFTLSSKVSLILSIYNLYAFVSTAPFGQFILDFSIPHLFWKFVDALTCPLFTCSAIRGLGLTYIQHHQLRQSI